MFNKFNSQNNKNKNGQSQRNQGLSSFHTAHSNTQSNTIKMDDSTLMSDPFSFGSANGMQSSNRSSMKPMGSFKPMRMQSAPVNNDGWCDDMDEMPQVKSQVHKGATSFMPPSMSDDPLSGKPSNFCGQSGFNGSFSMSSMPKMSSFGRSELGRIPQKQHNRFPPKPMSKITNKPMQFKSRSVEEDISNDFGNLSLGNSLPSFSGLGFPSKQSKKQMSFMPPAPKAFGNQRSNKGMDFFIPPAKVKFTGLSIKEETNEGSKVPLTEPLIKPDYYNQFTSCTVSDSPNDVMDKLLPLLDSYPYEMEKQVNKDQFEIEGTVYISHKPVKFGVSIWKNDETKDAKTLIEFQKRRSDPMLFQQFFSEMIELIATSFKDLNDCQRCSDFKSFFMPEFTLESDSDEDLFDNDDLSRWAEQINEDYRDDAFDVVSAISSELKSDKFCQMMLKHDELMNAINGMLEHQDIAHVRGGLCLLHELICNNAPCIEYIMNMKSNKIMDQLASLLTHKSILIQKHTVRLLSSFSRSKSSWNLSMKDYNNVTENMAQRSKDFKNCNYKIVSKSMFDEISKKCNCDMTNKNQQ